MHQLLPRIIQQGKCVSARSLGISFGFLSGPTFAEPLATGQPSGAVLAARTLALARECASLFASSIMRIYPSTDIIGVEACGALKNVYALLAGGLEGLPGHGINTVSLLTTRGAKVSAFVLILCFNFQRNLLSFKKRLCCLLPAFSCAIYSSNTLHTRLEFVIRRRFRALQLQWEGRSTQWQVLLVWAICGSQPLAEAQGTLNNINMRQGNPFTDCQAFRLYRSCALHMPRLQEQKSWI